MEGHARRIELGDQLQQVGARLRRAFLDALADLGHTHHAKSDAWRMAWWTSRLAERNTLVSPLFLHCCYLWTANQFIAEPSGGICIIAESSALLRLLTRMNRNSLRVRAVRELLWEGSLPARIVAGAAWFAYRSLRDWFCAWLTRRTPQITETAARRPLILIHTYADESSLQDSGMFADRYFGPLYGWLSARGYHVLTLATFLKAGRSGPAACAWLRRSRQQFLIAADYFRLPDYLRAVANGLRQMFLSPQRLLLAGVDVADLAREECRRQITAGDLRDAMYADLMGRLAQTGFRFHQVIHTFENHAAEKALNLGIQKYLPNAGTLGFQHGAIFPFRLCCATTRSEAEIAPLPDRIICNGPHFRDLLAQEEFPPGKLVTGCALRYQHLYKNGTGRAAESPRYIAVTLPLEPAAAAELLSKTVRSLEGLAGERVHVKAHPMGSIKQILSMAGLKRLPEGFSSAHEDIAATLSAAKLVISGGSATLLEAVAAGTPVVLAGSDLDLDMNPLAWWPDLCAVVRTPEQIRAEVLRILRWSPEDLVAYRERARMVLPSCFLPLSEERMQVFAQT